METNEKELKIQALAAQEKAQTELRRVRDKIQGIERLMEEKRQELLETFRELSKVYVEADSIRRAGAVAQERLSSDERTRFVFPHKLKASRFVVGEQALKNVAESEGIRA
nr:hypothetical protein 5 [Desulfobacteraceae bacterium]